MVSSIVRLAGWDITQNVILVQFVGDLIQPGKEIIGIENGKASRPSRQGVEHLLVGGNALVNQVLEVVLQA